MPNTPKDDTKASKPADSKMPKKIVDVAAPGKTAPPASSKPIIVSNRPILRRDPMMAQPGGLTEHTSISPISRVAKTIKVGTVDPLSDEQKAADTPAEAAPAEAAAEVVAAEAPPAAAQPTAPTIADLMKKKIDVQPDTEEPKSEEARQTAQDVGTEAVESVIPEPGKAAQPEAQPAEQQAPAKPTEVSSVPEKPEALPANGPIANDSVPSGDRDIDGVDADGDGQLAPNQVVDQAKRKEAAEQATKLAEQEKIIDSKQYFLSIHDKEKRKGLEFTILVLVIVLALTVVWLDLMLDAGILHIAGMHAFTHFFSS